uniref:Plakophilin 4 n=1 Tax=Kryptolebias marmoratus TaxID=37003 RepID=A0A3Q2ZJG2_KRYMA
MDNDRVVCSVATALRNMALDGRNKELIGKYAMRDLVNRLPGGSPSVLSDETVASVCCTLHEVTSRNIENAKALADSGGIEKLVDISKGRGKGYSMKVVKAAAQVLNTLWQYRELRSLYKQDGWNYTHFVTPVSTLERDRYRSQPTLPTSPLQMSPVIQSGLSADNRQFNLHKRQYTGLWRRVPQGRVHGPLVSPFYDEPDRKNYNSYRMYLSSPQGYGEEHFEDEPVHLTPSSPDGFAGESLQFKANTNYVDFYSTTRRPTNRANNFTGSPDSWV